MGGKWKDEGDGTCLLSSGRALLSADPALLDLVEQRFIADAELYRGSTPIPVDLSKGLLDHRALSLERRRLRDVRQPRTGGGRGHRRFRWRRVVVSRVVIHIVGAAL